MLVGVDDHSDFPAEVVGALPRVGPDLGVDPAKVVALKPDLVLASLSVPGHEKVVDGLLAARLPVVVLEPTSVSDVYDNILQVAELLGVRARGEHLVSEMIEELSPVKRTLEGVPNILVEWWPKPVIVPGRDSWVNDLLAAAGGKNPLCKRPVRSTPITDDEALALGADAVVISWCGVRPEKYRPHIVYRRERWKTIPAIRHRRVFCVPEAYLGRPGPRLVEGVRQLRRVVAACRQSS